MDLTPIIPAGRQLIETYGDGRFRITGTAYEGSVLVTKLQTFPWTCTDVADLDFESLQPLIDDGDVRVLLLGCGRRMVPVPTALRLKLREHGITIDAMDTGAACRTYNVLLAEDRQVAAALIAV